MAGQSSPFGQNGWIGRPWLARPSKGHEATDFLGINSCSTCKKVPKNAKFVDVYCFCLTFVYSGTVVSIVKNELKPHYTFIIFRPSVYLCLRKKAPEFLYHTPLEGSSGSEQSTRLMTFTQPFYDISGIQNRKEQNFLARTFSVIAILRYPTFSYCFYYIATFEPSHFCEIFTKFLVISEWIYLGL